MMRTKIVIAITAAVFAFCIWAIFNRPVEEPTWPERIHGFCLSPMQAGQSPLTKRYPTEDEIRSDLSLLSGKSQVVRTYSVQGTLGKVPELAKSFGLNVVLGAWIDSDTNKNEKEVNTLINIARANVNVQRVIVGNESLLRGDISKSKLIDQLEKVRNALSVPVSTAEPWHEWLKHPDMVEHVDYLAVHLLPYWEGVHVDSAVDYIVDRIEELKARFPGKPVVIAEAGWPSNGRLRKHAAASRANEAIFLRRFVARAQKEQYDYFLMEAFDQPWKQALEGSVGAYWGVYDVNRSKKLSLDQQFVSMPYWKVKACFSIVLATALLFLLLQDSRMLHYRGRIFLSVISHLSAAAVVWIVYEHFSQYCSVKTVLVGIFLMVGLTGAIAILMTETHEWAEALWAKTRRNKGLYRKKLLGSTPFVSIHVPTHNEPPAMLALTLDALSHLDYPNFEVLVIDNNTKDDSVWRPIEEKCAHLGNRFHFFHVDPLEGYKAGALNFALSHTSPRADIVAVVDSDYVVDRCWLRDLTPHFGNPRVALVQAPQDYRDETAGLFKSICYSEYRGFFSIGMVTRDQRNAIIQHGTMTMVRRRVLDRVGGWANWCISEDAELGLRIFEQGYLGLYIHRSYGKGLMPDTFRDYQSQRFRWAYGAVQIVRQHFKQLMRGTDSHLDRGQRYHFIAGWLPWFADAANLVFTLFAVILSVTMIAFPDYIDPPSIAISILLPLMFMFRILKTIHLYRTRVRTSLAVASSAAFAGLALSFTIAKAVLLGMIYKGMPFHRTPKLCDLSGWRHGFVGTIFLETVLSLMLLSSVVGVYIQKTPQDFNLYLWMAVLSFQSVPFLASILLAAIDAMQHFHLSVFAGKKYFRKSRQVFRSSVQPKFQRRKWTPWAN